MSRTQGAKITCDGYHQTKVATIFLAPGTPTGTVTLAHDLTFYITFRHFGLP
jgi:hypothetical protein